MKGNTHNHGGHRVRMYEKFLGNDLSTFPEHELFEVLLYYIETRKNTNNLGHEMKKYFGSITKISDVDYRVVQSTFDLTDRAATFFKVIGYIINARKIENILSDEDFVDKPVNDNYLLHLFKKETNEVFYVICLDNQLKMTQTIKIVEGSTNKVEILLKKMNQDLSLIAPPYIILVHNHPKETLRPSIADIDSTKKIIIAFEPFGIKVYDHYLVGSNKCYSFRKHNLIFDEEGYP